MSFRLVQSGDSQSSEDEIPYYIRAPPAEEIEPDYIQAQAPLAGYQYEPCDDFEMSPMSITGACGGGGSSSSGGACAPPPAYGDLEYDDIDMSMWAPKPAKTPAEPRYQPTPPKRYAMFAPSINWALKDSPPHRNLMRAFRQERTEIYANDTPPVRGTIPPFLGHAREGSDSSIEWEDPLTQRVMGVQAQCRSSSVDRQSMVGFGRSSGSPGVSSGPGYAGGVSSGSGYAGGVSSGSGYEGGISSGGEQGGCQQPLRHCTTPIDGAQCGAGSRSSSEQSWWSSDSSAPLEMHPIEESPIYQQPFVGARQVEIEEFPLVGGMENFEIYDPETGYFGDGQSGGGGCCPGGRCNIL